MHAFVEENFGLIINRYRRQTEVLAIHHALDVIEIDV